MFKSRRFYHFFFSYSLMIVIVLLIVGGVVYGAFFQTLRQEAETSMISTLSQYRDMMDLRMSEMERVALHIASNPLLTPFQVSEGGFSSFEAVQELRKYRATSLFVREIILFYKVRDSSLLYGAGGTYRTDGFFEDIYRFRDWDRDRWLEALHTVNAPVLRPMDTVYMNNRDEGKLSVFLYPIPDRAENPYGVVMFLIDESAFRNISRNVLADTPGFLLILDENRNVVYRYTQDQPEETAEAVTGMLLRQSGRNGIRSLELDGQQFTAIGVESERSPLSYVAVYPDEYYMKKVDSTRSLFDLTVAFVFLLGLGIAFLFSRGKAGEFESMFQTAGRLAREKEGLLFQMRSQASAVRAQAVHSLIRGKIQSPEELEHLKRMLQFSNLKLEHPYFVVLVFLIDDYNQFQADHTPVVQDLMKYSFMQMFEEIAAEAGEGAGMEQVDGRSIIFLLNLDEAHADMACVKQIALRAKTFFKQTFRHTLTAGIGSICREAEAIPVSYEEASLAARYRFLKGCEQLIAFTDISPRRSKEFLFPVQAMQRLTAAIRQGNGAEVEALVRDALRRVVEENLSLEAAECICFDLVNTILKTLMELDMEIHDALGGKLEKLSVSEFETIEELEDLAIDICRTVCAEIRNRKESKNMMLLDRMKRYIHDHYAEESLHLERIAAHFGLSASYATRFFKDQTGIPLMRYVDQLRMERAKQLLLTTDLHLKEIVGEIGYLDPNHFIRKFKKYEGVTPIHYRRLIKGKSPGREVSDVLMQ